MSWKNSNFWLLFATSCSDVWLSEKLPNCTLIPNSSGHKQGSPVAAVSEDRAPLGRGRCPPPGRGSSAICDTTRADGPNFRKQNQLDFPVFLQVPWLANITFLNAELFKKNLLKAENRKFLLECEPNTEANS